MVLFIELIEFINYSFIIGSVVVVILVVVFVVIGIILWRRN